MQDDNRKFKPFLQNRALVIGEIPQFLNFIDRVEESQDHFICHVVWNTYRTTTGRDEPKRRTIYNILVLYFCCGQFDNKLDVLIYQKYYLRIFILGALIH